MGKLTCEAVGYLQLLLSVYYELLHYQTPSDLASIKTINSGDTFDFIVVGGGSAGCVLASRLSEVTDWKILLLEAGGEEPQAARIPAFGNNLKLSNLDWQFLTQPQPFACGGKSCRWPRGKVLGGGSSVNDMIYNRGNKYDFEHWAALGNKGWDYENVLYYFKKSENNLDEDIARSTRYHSKGGMLSIGRFPYTDHNVPLILKGYQDLGFKIVDFNGERVLGAAHLQGTQHYGVRRSTNRAFLEPIRHHRPNLKIVTNARVVKVLINPSTKEAYGVQYIGEKDRSIKGHVYAKKEVILSSGVINSPHILLLSGVGPKETLESLHIPVIKNLKVGYNLHDHVGSAAVIYIVGNSTRPTFLDIMRDTLLYSKEAKTGPWSGIGPISVTSFVNSRYADKSIDFPDVQFSTLPSLLEASDQKCGLKFTIPWCYYNRITLMPGVLRPKSRGYVTINTTDPFESPLIYPNYFEDPYDMTVLIDGLNAVAKLEESKTFKEHGFVLDRTPPPKCKHLHFGTDEYWDCVSKIRTHSNYSPVGTCKMGPASDPDAVVDPALRVYGVKNLRVIDSSIMPITTSGNTNAPSIMIGEKGADLVKESYGRRWKGDIATVDTITAAPVKIRRKRSIHATHQHRRHGKGEDEDEGDEDEGEEESGRRSKRSNSGGKKQKGGEEGDEDEGEEESGRRSKRSNSGGKKQRRGEEGDEHEGDEDEGDEDEGKGKNKKRGNKHKNEDEDEEEEEHENEVVGHKVRWGGGKYKGGNIRRKRSRHYCLERTILMKMVQLHLLRQLSAGKPTILQTPLPIVYSGPTHSKHHVVPIVHKHVPFIPSFPG